MTKTNTPADNLIQRSYEMLGILATCELALDAVRKSHVGIDTGNIGLALRAANRFAGEVHDELERRLMEEGPRRATA